MDVLFGVAKIHKYAVSESGDTLEMVERPRGGLSLVLVDGQRSGKSAKKISNIVARKAIQLLAEGVRDGATARAASDYLFNLRDGKVTATLNMISIDAVSKTLVITRNNPCPVLVYTPQLGLYTIDADSCSIGTRMSIKPHITELPMELGPIVVAYTDGLRHAGARSGAPFDAFETTRSLLRSGFTDPQGLADGLLEAALACDQGRPGDDISVLVVQVKAPSGDEVRRVSGRLPLR